uniref:uncharacterized protein LOC105349413 n=1 Tax=Fragaria vesca subsp. vesca TaxID=101020 RepID=UPI0005C7F679|nr:PREDICTED: uncharacterized protein LOC105349413 [Fragaria vesca subsp. vesca]
MANHQQEAGLELFDLAQMEEFPHQLIGCLVSDKSLNVATVIRMLRSAWQEIGWTHLEPIHDYHVYSITVESEEAGQTLKERSPWSVMGYSFGIHNWPLENRIQDLPLHMMSFWVQVHNLPRQNMTAHNAITIGAALGTIEEVEDPHSPEGRRGFLRIRTQIDTRNPLKATFKFQRGNPPKMANFRYERLLDFCYACGRLGHIARNCIRFGPNSSCSIDPNDYMQVWRRDESQSSKKNPSPYSSNQYAK